MTRNSCTLVQLFRAIFFPRKSCKKKYGILCLVNWYFVHGEQLFRARESCIFILTTIPLQTSRTTTDMSDIFACPAHKHGG